MNEVFAAVEKIHAANLMCCLAVTGSGAPAIGWLTSVSGSSRTLLDAAVPYAHRAIDEYIGVHPRKSVSASVSRMMAAEAYRRAARLRDSPAQPVVGIGSTGSIATSRERRGFNEFYCTCWGAQVARTYHCRLDKSRNRTRQEEDAIVCSGIIKALADACAVPFDIPFELGMDEPLLVSEFEISTVWFAVDGTRQDLNGPVPDLAPGVPSVVIPGSFNPLHPGHVGMAEAAIEYFQNKGISARVFFELSMTNMDKPPISDADLATRASQFQGKYDLIATRTPKFVDKVKLFPGHAFVVGYDTARRILDVKYAGGCAEARLAELRAVLEAGCSFLVAGRLDGERFMTLSDLPQSEGLTEEEWQALFQDLGTFQRVDISSTELRKQPPGP
eukprot:EG_transcript_13353